MKISFVRHLTATPTSLKPRCHDWIRGCGAAIHAARPGWDRIGGFCRDDNVIAVKVDNSNDYKQEATRR
jgi:hypothetical protein